MIANSYLFIASTTTSKREKLIAERYLVWLLLNLLTLASETCPYWFDFMNHFELLALIQSFQSVFTFLADRGLLASWRECACSTQTVLKERQNTPELKRQIKVYFNILIVTIGQKRAMIATRHKKRKINQTYMKYCKLWFRNALWGN